MPFLGFTQQSWLLQEKVMYSGLPPHSQEIPGSLHKRHAFLKYVYMQLGLKQNVWTSFVADTQLHSYLNMFMEEEITSVKTATAAEIINDLWSYSEHCISERKKGLSTPTAFSLFISSGKLLFVRNFTALTTIQIHIALPFEPLITSALKQKQV